MYYWRVAWHTSCCPHTAFSVANNEDEQYTVVLIKPQEQQPAALLNIASVLTGIGLSIHKGLIVSEVLLSLWLQS